ncbi:aminotransferase class I/II-fold pyridoxal phosphate-dependent enzyme [Bacillus tianshenii]|nr:aminotransferase class I/II-fold pyridoxal phosphate-dependent enzyme [Bacillus tianshenii]
MAGKLPLYEALVSHAKQHTSSFHVPGHKSGQAFPNEAAEFFRKILHIDLTEITGMDDLHAPEGIIEEAQQLTAELYGVRKSFFLVGGSTAGNLAMIAASCERGDLVFVQRNCHKSIFHALQLAGVKPVFLYPEIDEDTQTPVGLVRETLQEAIKQYPQAKALVLTYPSYYGLANDISELISLAHKHELTVLVDEAHGAHFVIGEPFPRSAVSMGADLVVQSAHKTLPAMTMASFLHLNSERVNEEKLVYYLQVFQSSSPSYPIMASLDIARYYLQSFIENNKKEAVIQEIQCFKEELVNIGYQVVKPKHDAVRHDPLKVILQADASGYELQQALEAENIFTELADPLNVLLVLPLDEIKQKEEILSRFKQAMLSLNQSMNQKASYTVKQPKQSVAALMLSYNDIQAKTKYRLPFKQAIGAICAEMIVPYPPGVALLMPGEMIELPHIEQIHQLKEMGARFQNGEELWNEGILVVRD